MQLDELYDYKNRLMQDLLTNERIVDLIEPGMETDDARSLAYKRVYPSEYIPETVEEGHTYICFDVDVSKSYNDTFLEPVLYIWVFTHKSLMRLPEGGLRVDALCSEIAKAINGSFYYGIGKLDLYSVARFAPMEDYLGKCMTFEATEFNRPYNPKKQIPSNRKFSE